MNEILQALRAQAWERAKAELAAIQQADYPPSSNAEDRATWEHKCATRREVINNFVAMMEGDELYR